MNDDDFEPKLGRMRAKGPRREPSYLGRVIAAAAKSGVRAGKRSRRFDGSRIGRGASIARVLGSRDRHATFRTRRVIVKTRLVRLGGKGLAGAHAHLRYIERDGVTREGAPGELYSAGSDEADGKAFLERCDGDRHQFRLIVAPEDGDLYPDLKPFVRRLMVQMEADLGTKLDWVAVDHFNTGHPHSHIMLRGKDEQGQNLVIARDYISHGMRARAIELATLDLGPRTDLEIEERLRHDVSQERLTAIDRRLLRAMDAERVVAAGDRDPFQQSLRAGRLRKLESFGLAEDLGGGRWRLSYGLADTLRQMGERGDIIRTLQRELSARNLVRRPSDRIIHDGEITTPVVGRVVARGLADELLDRHYLIVDGVDGRSHYADIGRADAVEPLPQDAIVRVSPRRPVVRHVDRTIAEIAAAHGGRYDIDTHLRHDLAATQEFAEAHGRRLEAIRRVMGSVEREPDGSWVIAPDHLERAAAYEARMLRDRPAEVEVLSAVPLQQLPNAAAATWLDREALAEVPEPIRDDGFGREVRTAQAQRRQWLIEQGLAEERDGQILYRANLLAILQRRELLRVAGQLSDELGLQFIEPQRGERIEGMLQRRVNLASGRFALVQKSKEFTLVPWRPVFERQLGKEIAGINRSEGISWSIERGRKGPEIS